jgi:hypothetical protein
VIRLHPSWRYGLLIAALAPGLAHATALPVIAACRVTDTCSAGGPASGNGRVDPGEEGLLTLVLRNDGDSVAQRVRVLLASSDPQFVLLADTADFPDIPAGATADALVTLPYRVVPETLCGTTFTLDATIAYNTIFRADQATVPVPANCFACGANLCDPANLRPFSAGPYGINLHDVVDDFTVPTLDGDWNFRANWTGCDGYMFVVLRPGFAYSQQLWDSAFDPFLQRAPKNSHLFFMVESGDPTVVANQIAAMRGCTDAAVAALPPADQAAWAGRLHHVTTNAAGLGNWISDFLAAQGVAAFGIDLSQRLQDVGLLYFVGAPPLPGFQHLTHELRAYNFDRERQRQLDWESFTEVVVWPDSVHGGGQFDIVFPDADTMAHYDTLLFDLSWECTDPWDSRSCEWDYLGNLYLCDPQDPANCGQEFARWISAYGRGGRWVTDMSPYLALVKDGGPRRVSYNAPYPYRTSLKILLGNRGKGVRPYEAQWLYGGGGFVADYNANHPPKTLCEPSWPRKAEFAALITGHGFGNNAENCAEFCNHQHRFSLNGTSVMREFPEAGTQYGCVDQIEKGTTPNQYGTWHYGRGGWCPGLDVPAWHADVTAGLRPELNQVTYEGLFQGAPYTPTPIPNGNGFEGRIDMSSYLVLYIESPETDCADGLDNDGDGLADCADQGCGPLTTCDAFDTDGDTLPNSSDADRLDPTLLRAPAGLVHLDVLRRSGTSADVSWAAMSAAAGTSTRADIITGVLSELRADMVSGQGFARASCLLNEVSANTSPTGARVEDARTFPAGTSDCFYYVLRGANCAGSEPFYPLGLQGPTPCD